MPGAKAPRAGGPRRPIELFAKTLDTATIPLEKGFSYASTIPMSEEDLREYLLDPIAALPPKVCELIGPVRIVLVPFLTRSDGDDRVSIVAEKPAANRVSSAFLPLEQPTVFLAVKDETSPDYHHSFFNAIAHLLSTRVNRDLQGSYAALLLTEIDQDVNGEVDEPSWARKQALPKRSKNGPPSVSSKAFREYAAQSFADTMTLYMHGICCDIDVETGPRQVPSRWLRKRLEKLCEMFPPPPGRAVLPEQISRK